MKAFHSAPSSAAEAKEAGSQSRRTQKISRSRVAMTKEGVATEAVDQNMMKRSLNLFCLTAAIEPRTMPTTKARSKAIVPILAETLRPLLIIHITVRPLVFIEGPKSKVRAERRYFPNWTYH